MNMYLNIILIIILIAVLAWREIQILIDRKSYVKENLRFNPYWYIKQKGFKRLFDSFHVSNGLAVLIINILTKDLLPHPFIDAWFYVPVYWVIFMQIRNLAMLLIYREG